MTETPSTGSRSSDRGGYFVHADAVLVAETGILIRGASGIGKSRLALTLIFSAQAAGYFSRLVGDDRIFLERFGDRLVARAHPAIRGAIEWRGQGIFETSFLDAAVLGLVVDLVPPEARALPRCPDDDALVAALAGTSVPAMPLRSDLGPSDQAANVLQRFRLHRKKTLGGPPAADIFP
jgi:serine kinase of HPr protein (carbohydrate metabolism regulator)